MAPGAAAFLSPLAESRNSLKSPVLLSPAETSGPFLRSYVSTNVAGSHEPGHSCSCACQESTRVCIRKIAEELKGKEKAQVRS